MWLIRYKMSARSAHSPSEVAIVLVTGKKIIDATSRPISSPQHMTRESPERESARSVRPSETQAWPLPPLSINL